MAETTVPPGKARLCVAVRPTDGGTSFSLYADVDHALVPQRGGVYGISPYCAAAVKVEETVLYPTFDPPLFAPGQLVKPVTSAQAEDIAAAALEAGWTRTNHGPAFNPKG
jgi:hypothetical protein